jgi:hypothetical protein
MKEIFNMQILITAAAICSIAAGQTQVDLRSQSKSVDFSAIPGTKPFQTGAALPGTCNVGQVFFLTTATGGQNIFGCSAVNTWTTQTALSPGTTIEASGTLVGTRSTVDLSSGPGIVLVANDTGAAISIQPSLDTSFVQTLGGHQRGTAVLCTSAGGSATHYSCSLSPTLPQYTAGMLVNWLPDTTAAGGATTINIDTLGAKSVTLADGTANATTADIVAGHMYFLWYDGSVFRLINRGRTDTPGGFANVQASTSPIAQNGADVAVYTINNVPALAAGACYRLFFGESSTVSGITVKLFVDSTLIATPIVASGASRVQGSILYCNQQGTQSVQSLVYLTPLFTGTEPSAQYSNKDEIVNTPPPVDWSVSHSLYFMASGAGGFVTGQGFGIY